MFFCQTIWILLSVVSVLGIKIKISAKKVIGRKKVIIYKEQTKTIQKKSTYLYVYFVLTNNKKSFEENLYLKLYYILST